MKMTIDYDKDQLAYALANALKERDAAIAHWEEVREYGTYEINTAVDLRQKLAQALVELDNMQDQRDLAMKVIKRLGNVLCKTEKERDEAQADPENSRQSLGFSLEELNEAREEAHRFRLLYYSHLGINGSASWFPWEEKLDNV
jgi:hypothetical protein